MVEQFLFTSYQHEVVCLVDFFLDGQNVIVRLADGGEELTRLALAQPWERETVIEILKGRLARQTADGHTLH